MARQLATPAGEDAAEDASGGGGATEVTTRSSKLRLARHGAQPHQNVVMGPWKLPELRLYAHVNTRAYYSLRTISAHVACFR